MAPGHRGHRPGQEWSARDRPVGGQPEEPDHDRGGGGLAIAGAPASSGWKVVAAVVFVVLAISTVVLPVALYRILGNRAQQPLESLNVWLQANNAAVMAVLILVIVVVLIGKGFIGILSELGPRADEDGLVRPIMSGSPDYFFALDSFRFTAARMRVFNAFSFIFSPSWKSMARLVFPSRLELKRPEGSSTAAPFANVIFTTAL